MSLLNKFKSRKCIAGIILAIFALIMGCVWWEWYIGIAFALTFLVIGCIGVDIKSAKWKYLFNLVWGVIIINITFHSTFLMIESQYAANITTYKTLMNVLCMLILCAVPFFVTTSWKKAIIITSSVLMFLSAVNGFIYQFRGKEFGPMDLLSIKTAMNVAGQYKGEITARMAYAWLGWLAAVFLQFSLPDLPKLPKMKTRIGTLLAEGILIILLFIGTNNITVRTWTDEGTRLNGYYLNFFLSLRDSFVDKPENYSSQKVEEYAKKYENITGGAKEKAPNIIVIMDESFVDFNIFDEEVHTNKPVTPFINSLTENTVKGYALSSVYGGNTANSEFEFLTGHSLAWLPTNSVAYQQYINNRKMYTLTWMLRSYGYKCMATHPYYANGWSRNRVYPYLGFEEYTFIEDYPQQNMLRKYVSDREMFEYLLDKLQNKDPEKPLFLFGVTMQNHGGYDYYGENYEEDIQLEGYSRDYPLARQYLNVSNKTDQAFEFLLGELANYPEETIVLFYGDHFPKVETEFYEELHGGGFDTLEEQIQQYKIPFVIWANYDIAEQFVECTSINYLSRYLMETAGFELSPYHQYLKEAEEVIPAMNSLGYYSIEKNKFVTFDEAEGEEAAWLEKHSVLQYNNMFDPKHRNNLFFGQYIS